MTEGDKDHEHGDFAKGQEKKHEHHEGDFAEGQEKEDHHND